jgi:hypothetical protein
MLALLLLGCDPCRTWKVADVRIDENGLLDEASVARIRRTVDEFYDASGATDACVREVHIDSDLVEEYRARSHEVELRADVAISDYWLRKGLCEILHDARDYPSDDTEAFLRSCASGPAHFDFADDVMAACGTSELTPADAFVRTHVWPNVEAVEHDSLHLEEGESTVVATHASSVAGVDDLVAIETYDPKVDETWISLVDPWTGAQQAMAKAPGNGRLHAGAGLAVHVSWADPGSALTSIDASGESRTVVTDHLDDNTAASIGDTLYVAGSPWDEQQPLVTADLLTGASGAVEYPTAPRGYLTLGDVRGVSHEELLVGLSTSTVDADCGSFDCFIKIHTYDEWLALYDPGSGEWSEAARFRFFPAGTMADGMMVGELWSDAGWLFAAWDPTDGRLAVSRELCAESYPGLGFVAGEAAWWANSVDDGDAVELTPMTIRIE